MPISKHRRRRGRVAPGSSRSSASLSLNQGKRKTNWLYLSASLVIAILVIGGFVVGSGGFGTGAVTKGSSEEHIEGIGVEQDIMATRDHITEGTDIEYNATLPTSGNHWPQPSKCGFFEDGLPNERIVHNLEHSNIVISYNFSSESEIERLKDVLKGIGLNNTLGVTRFYEKIESGTVAMAAWGILDTMEGIDEERIKKFFETYAGNLGPEGNISCLTAGAMP